MPRRIRGPSGVIHVVPDDATDAEVAQILGGDSKPAPQSAADITNLIMDRAGGKSGALNIPILSRAYNDINDPSFAAGMTPGQTGRKALSTIVDIGADAAPLAASMMGPAGLLARTAVVAGTTGAADVVKHYAKQMLGTTPAKPFEDVVMHAAGQAAIQAALEGVPGVVSKAASAVVGAKYLNSPQVRAVQVSAAKLGIKPGAPMQASVDSAVDTTLKQIQAARTESGVVGQGLVDAVELGQKNFKNEVGNFYQDIQNMVGPRPVDTSRLAKEGNAIYQSTYRIRASASPGLGSTSPEALALFADVTSGKPLTWEQASARRSMMIEAAKSPDAVVSSTANRLLPAMNEAMTETAKAAGPDVAQLWGHANELYGSGSRMYESKLITGLAAKAPEEVVHTILQNPLRARQVMTALADANQPAVKTGLQRHMLQEIVSPVGNQADYFGLGKRLEQYDSVLKEVMDTPDAKMSLANLRELSSVTDKLPELKVGLPGSEQRSQFNNMINTAISIATGRYYRIPYAAAKAMGRPVFTSILLNGKSTKSFASGIVAMADGRIEVGVPNMVRAIQMLDTASKVFPQESDRQNLVKATEAPN